MDRREFLKGSAAGVLLLALPARLGAALSGLREDEVERRAAELLAQMTLDEKIEQMHGEIPLDTVLRRAILPSYPSTWNTASNRRLNIPALRCIDGPRGIGSGRATCFPVGMGRGATWDAALEERIGEAMGYEGRALGANMVLSPCINLLRHPSWGRAQETYGEDPVLLGIMGAAHVVGVQKHAMACPKHFAANSIEESRFYVNVVMDERTLRELYLPHFKRCVDVKAASVMSAYNDLNGFLCGQNPHLIRTILKGEWGFDGFVISDWSNAVDDTVAAAMAGLDVEMPTGAHLGRKLKRAVLAGQVPEAVVNEAVTRILRQKLRFLSSDDPRPGYDPGRVASPEHTALAREAAHKGIVLLKNEKNALPLRPEDISSIAVFGKLADTPNIGDRGSSAVNPPYVITPLAGITDRAGERIKVSYHPGDNLRSVRQIAGRADAVIVVVGLTWKDEGEGGYFYGDRINLGLSRDQEKMIIAAAEANPRTIVVLEGGAAITVTPWVDQVAALLMAWYPGMEGGAALADILFGQANPSGKLPITFHLSADQLPLFDNESRTVTYDAWHGYRLFDRDHLTPAFPFGFGLSYTRYKYSRPILSSSVMGKRGRLTVSVEVANEGPAAGEEVVQLYVGARGSKVERAVKELKGFSRVALGPGEKKVVEFELQGQELAFYNMAAQGWEVEETEYEVLVGGSSRPEDLLSAHFRISGE